MTCQRCLRFTVLIVSCLSPRPGPTNVVQKMRSAFGGGVAATGTGASAGTTTGGASKETKAKRKDLMRGLVVGAFQRAKVDNAVAAAHKSADKSD